MTSTEQLSVYVRQWHPSTLTLDLPKEVVLQDSVVEELKDEVRGNSIWSKVKLIGDVHVPSEGPRLIPPPCH